MGSSTHQKPTLSDLLRPDSETVKKIISLLGEDAPMGIKGETPGEVAELVHCLRIKFNPGLKLKTVEKAPRPPVPKRSGTAIDEFVQSLLEDLKNSGKARIPRLGVLKVIEVPAEAGKTSARKIVRFVMGKDLEDYFQAG